MVQEGIKKIRSERNETQTPSKVDGRFLTHAFPTARGSLRTHVYATASGQFSGKLLYIFLLVLASLSELLQVTVSQTKNRGNPEKIHLDVEARRMRVCA